MSDHTPVLFNVFDDWNEEPGICRTWRIFTDQQNYKHNSDNTQLSYRSTTYALGLHYRSAQTEYVE